ncbi:hypothetical protein Tco_1146262 [Tanacetum coccineum]
MVAYLKKPEGSEGFHQIVDFLNASHIRRHLQLADADGISSLPTTKIFEQLSLMGAHHTPTSAPSTLQPPVSSTSRRTTRQESVVPQPRSPTQTLVADETVHEERGDSVERAATTATSLDAEQGSGNINRTQSTTIPNDPFPQGIGSGGSPRRQDTILGDRPAQTRFERLSKQSNDPPLSRVNTLGSGEDSMTLQELMVFCTTLSKKVESLETDLKQTKQIYGAAYTRLIKKVKKLEKTVKSSQARRRARIVVSDDEDDLEDPSKQGRKIAEIQGRYGHDMEFDFDVAKEVSTARAAVTTASVSCQEQERLDFEAAVRLQAELEEEERERIGRRLQAEEREKYTEAEQARMLAKLINQRKRYFAAQRAEERRNKPPLQAQQRTYMSNYIKHMGGYTLQQLRGYSFDEIKNLFETTMRSVNTFVPIKSEVDRAVPELVAESLKGLQKKNLIKKVLRGKRLLKAQN